MSNTTDNYLDRATVEVFLRHFAQCPAVWNRAKALGMTAADFVPGGPFPLLLYKYAVDLLFLLDSPPIAQDVLLVTLMKEVKQGRIPQGFGVELVDLFDRVLNNKDPLQSDWVVEQLPKFIRARRASKILAEAGSDVDRIHAEYEKIIFPLDTLTSTTAPAEERFIRPFRQLYKKDVFDAISTGLPRLDASLGGGMSYRGLGLIVGYSGGGKTALGVSIARGAALTGHKVIYCSMEEEKEDIANRLYSAVFMVDYTSLHNGSGYMELEQKYNNGDEAEKKALLDENLVILDLKGESPVRPSVLKKLVDDFAVKEKFDYELLIIDQLQFLEPNSSVPGESEWLKEQRVLADVDAISHLPVGTPDSNKYFSIWMLHQAKGKLRAVFSTEEIAGFKGIVHKPEVVLGIGRDGPTAETFELFSLKNRHAKNFRLSLDGNLTYMSFIEKADTTGEAPMPMPAPASSAGMVTSLIAGNSDAPEMEFILAPPTPGPSGRRPPLPDEVLPALST